jgi:hypothetical protein
VANQIVKLSALPSQFRSQAKTFNIGMEGKDLKNGSFSMTDLDHKTGFQLSPSFTPDQAHNMALDQHWSPPGKAGITVDIYGSSRTAMPVKQDLDGDGRKQESTVLTCNRAVNVCLCALRQGISQEKYGVKWILAFTGTK